MWTDQGLMDIKKHGNTDDPVYNPQITKLNKNTWMWKIIYRVDRGLGVARGQRKTRESGGEYSEALYAHINISMTKFNKKDKNSNYVLSI